MRVEVTIPSLHYMIIREPFNCGLGMFVDRGGVQGDGLVVRNVAPALAFTGYKLRVKAPGNN